MQQQVGTYIELNCLDKVQCKKLSYISLVLCELLKFCKLPLNSLGFST